MQSRSLRQQVSPAELDAADERLNELLCNGWVVVRELMYATKSGKPDETIFRYFRLQRDNGWATERDRYRAALEHLNTTGLGGIPVQSVVQKALNPKE